MKARVNETDEILKVVDVSLDGDCVWCQKGDDIIRYRVKDVELIREKNIDWENRRFELFKATASGIMANTEYFKTVCMLRPHLRDESNKEKELTTYEAMAIEVRKFADAVLAEYRKGENK